eukprot:6801979-Prymnesium_polylepis.1
MAESSSPLPYARLSGRRAEVHAHPVAPAARPWCQHLPSEGAQRPQVLGVRGELTQGVVDLGLQPDRMGLVHVRCQPASWPGHVRPVDVRGHAALHSLMESDHACRARRHLGWAEQLCRRLELLAPLQLPLAHEDAHHATPIDCGAAAPFVVPANALEVGGGEPVQRRGASRRVHVELDADARVYGAEPQHVIARPNLPVPTKGHVAFDVTASSTKAHEIARDGRTNRQHE